MSLKKDSLYNIWGHPSIMYSAMGEGGGDQVSGTLPLYFTCKKGKGVRIACKYINGWPLSCWCLKIMPKHRNSLSSHICDDN